jgi:hypothetical protein
MYVHMHALACTRVRTVVGLLHVVGRMALEGAQAQAGDPVEHAHPAAQAVVPAHLAVAASSSGIGGSSIGSGGGGKRGVCV